MSVRDQTLPTRTAALVDAKQHFDECEASANADRRDFALLGLIGEALQALEDVAYLGDAYESESSLPAPRYIAATIYSGFKPTTFYRGIKKWSTDRLLDLAGMRVRYQ